jgi:CRP-like cAMP-binding protein
MTAGYASSTFTLLMTASRTRRNLQFSGTDTLRSGALDSDVQIDVEISFVRAMVDIDAPHVRVLNFASTHGSYGTTVRELAHQIPELERILTPAIATLERHGTVQRIQPDVVKVMQSYETNRSRGIGTPSTPDPAWRVTKFGVECLTRLRAPGLPASGADA